MAYIALYRKYRPNDFDNIVGQDVIKNALRYQILNDKIGHSYIFSGIRGTGKTSMAKVFAKAINCLKSVEGNPCNKCESCISFNEGSSIDVVEMDAASNNGVDDIRELRENSYLMPAYNKYKVYIIDEVQMLSNGAFNALLKTLEEPSDNVVFILATTEINKIPDTILSRCQKYGFKRISGQDIVYRLKEILKREDIEFEEEALELIAKHSGGALRDAISLLDKVLSYTIGILTKDLVINSLGLINIEQINKLTYNILSSNIDVAYTTFEELVNNGKIVGNIIVDMMSFIREIIISRMIGSKGNNTKDFISNYRDVSTEDLKNLLNELDELYKNIKFVYSPKLSFELILFNWSNKEVADNKIEEDITCVEKIKKELVKEEKTNKVVEVSTKFDFEILVSKWEECIDFLKKDQSLLGAYMMEAKPVSIEGKIINVRFDLGFEHYVDNVNDVENNKKIVKQINSFYNIEYSLRAFAEEDKSENKSDDEFLDFFGKNVLIKE